MQSLRQLYRIGRGPSSSHTIAPEHAVRRFSDMFPQAQRFKAVLYGSLAFTGVGHNTDKVIKETFLPKPSEVLFDKKTSKLPHPNTMDLIAYSPDGEIGRVRVFSTGGGAYKIEGEPDAMPNDVYPLNTFTEIREYCETHDMQFYDYVRQCEGEEIFNYLAEVWSVMQASIREGLKVSGVLPGCLGVERKAKVLFKQNHVDESPETRENRLVCAYAFAVGEQNAAGGTIATAPTCGAAGVLPAVLYYAKRNKNMSDSRIINALASAGLVGNLIKTNASISGAECGCQAEIGSATCMASAALAQLYGMDLNQLEYAAEIAMEHQLGLTCDPVCGLVQIPCIERNAVAAMRAMNSMSLASFLADTRKVSFDQIIGTMYQTGKDMDKGYRETSRAGLAKTLRQTKHRKRSKHAAASAPSLLPPINDG